MAAKRGAPAARAVIAGTIASRNGSASVAPMPRRKARRGNAILVITIEAPSIRARWRHSHLKRRARDDALNKRQEPVVRARRLTLDVADRRRVGGLNAAPQRIGQHLLGKGRQELIGMALEHVSQSSRAG